jgi:hypothetical protein
MNDGGRLIYVCAPDLPEPLDVLLEHLVLVGSVEERFVVLKHLAANLGLTLTRRRVELED